MAEKLWGSRFSKDTAPEVDAFTASIPFDQRLYRQDIAGSIAHARMLARQGIIGQADAETLVAGLKALQEDINAGRVQFRLEREDIHLNIEALLRERLGPEVAGRLHTARSRNDQVALDMRLYVRDACDTIDDGLQGVARALLDLAEANADAILPGYTHLQRAQPVLLAHHFLAYIEMLERDRERIAQCRARANVCPLGSGALAGTTFTIDRKFVADTLGFPAITRNSLDAVSDRDFVLDLLYAASVLMMHLSRLCEEIVLWSSAEFGFITLDDAYATGSSMMPQKKNPSVAELVRGKTGRVYGHLLGLLTVMKGLPLSYNQDMQEDKEGLFDTVDTVLAVLHIMPGMLRTMTIHKDTMLQAAHRGFTTATDLADHLVRRGLPFRQAYDIVGHLVRLCLDQGKEFHDLTILELQAVSPLLDEGALAILTPEAAVAARAIPGGTAPREVMAQIQAARQRWGYPAP